MSLVSTWYSEKISHLTAEFCDGGTESCVSPLMPQCEDRTILCLDELLTYDDMNVRNLTGNDTLHDHSIGAKYEYTCKDINSCENENDKCFINIPRCILGFVYYPKGSRIKAFGYSYIMGLFRISIDLHHSWCITVLEADTAFCNSRGLA